jgi:HlyD family secretion protein
LRAPFDGLVTAVYVAEGEFASGLAVALLDHESLEVVLTVDEADVGALAVGQEATVTLETWPDEVIESEIVKIAPSATVGESALVSYAVHLTLVEAARPVRAGMTANATLFTVQRENVLLLPSRAIIADREAGRFYVDLVTGSRPQAGGGEDGAGGSTDVQVERVEVIIGLRDDQNTQILEGLQAGDRVRVTTVAPVNLFGPPDQDGN